MLIDGTPAIGPRHSQDLPPAPAARAPAPVAESRGRGTDWGRREVSRILGISLPTHLLSPLPEKNAPRASAVDDS